MNATIAGLAVAVPAVIAQFWFSRRVERAALRMGTIVNRALDAVWRDEPTA
jgi:biopolymer transport protein ExbB/TolQ